jgi:molybdopterin-guanine dinucleotide biosynthesis protein A
VSPTPDWGGIFVGGRGTRMGGVAKGMLTTSDGETLVARWRRLFDAIGLRPVLVGRHPAYAQIDLPSIDDDPKDIGPLGGLVALLATAREARAIAVACDMPFVSPELLGKLTTFRSSAPIVAARRGGRWEPLFARYDAPRVIALARERSAQGRHSLQGLLQEMKTEVLPLTPAEENELADWDRPEDR